MLALFMVGLASGVATLLPGVAVAFALRFWIGPARVAVRLEAMQSPSGLVPLALVTSSPCD